MRGKLFAIVIMISNIIDSIIIDFINNILIMISDIIDSIIINFIDPIIIMIITICISSALSWSSLSENVHYLFYLSFFERPSVRRSDLYLSLAKNNHLQHNLH